MIGRIVEKELRQYSRDGRILAFLLVLLALGGAATLYSRTQVLRLSREAVTARGADRQVWNEQGAKNPHSAAHFSRYVFPPTSGLALFEPGVTSFVGKAVWLEAHYRDPARLRPVDDAAEVERIARLDPAWILQCLAPMLILLLGASSMAGERERGTLRILRSTGARPDPVFWGKALALLAFPAVLVPIVLGGVALATSGVLAPLPDATARLGLLALTYFIYLSAFVFAAVAVSARNLRSNAALTSLMVFWAFATVIAPRLGADLGSALYPMPEGSTFSAELHEEASSAFWGEDAQPVRDRIRDQLLEEHGVKDVADLPFNYDGYLLQASEEFANVVFDRRYGDLADILERQGQLSVLVGLLSPTVSVMNISRAIAGTDVHAHQHFADAAEGFRRELIKGLNQDMIDNAGKEGYGYLADRELWEKTPDFEYRAPALSETLARVWPSILILLGWTGLALMLARRSVRAAWIEETR